VLRGRYLLTLIARYNGDAPLDDADIVLTLDSPDKAVAALERLFADEPDRLRREQAATVMPLIGPLLDAWDGTPNDEKNPDSTLFRTMEKIARAMEGI
jgi:hypothetical protein